MSKSDQECVTGDSGDKMEECEKSKNKILQGGEQYKCIDGLAAQHLERPVMGCVIAWRPPKGGRAVEAVAQGDRQACLCHECIAP